MDKAIADLNTLYAIANHCTDDPTLIASLVSFAIEHIASDTFQYVLEHGNLTQENVKAIRLNPSLSFNRVLHRGMRMETAFGISIFNILSPSTASTAVHYIGKPAYPASVASAPYRVFLWKNDLSSYLQRMHKYEELSAQSYHESIQEWKSLGKEFRGQMKAGGFLSTMITPALSRMSELSAQADAKHRLALLATAMLRYNLAEGEFPKQLDQLTPKYILTVPIDPFTGDPMKYSRTAEGKVVIYSVAIDLKDDGGQAFDKKTQKGDIALTLKN